MPNTYHYTEDDYEQSILELMREMGMNTVMVRSWTNRRDATCTTVACPEWSPSRAVTNSEEAHQQLQNYMRQVPQLFTAAQMFVISDMADTRVGSITAPLDRFMEWKTPPQYLYLPTD